MGLPVDRRVTSGHIQLSQSLQEGFGYIRLDDLALIIRMVKSLPPNPIAVNIGAGVGTSVIAMLENRGDVEVYSIDIQGGISPTGGLGNEEEIIIRHGLNHLLSRRHPIVGDSKEIGKSFDKKVDLIFIDGDHSYEGAKGDIESWMPHLKDNGIIIMHDCETPIWTEVARAADDMLGGMKVIDKSSNARAYQYDTSKWTTSIGPKSTTGKRSSKTQPRSSR